MTREEIIDCLERDIACEETICEGECSECPYSTEIDEIGNAHREMIKILKESDALKDFADYVAQKYVHTPNYLCDGDMLIEEYNNAEKEN